jgi:hypothetical protein
MLREVQQCRYCLLLKAGFGVDDCVEPLSGNITVTSKELPSAKESHMPKQRKAGKNPPSAHPLRAALNSLAATGASGFGGFMRELLSHLTQQAFRIMKSGHQGGVDVLQEALPTLSGRIAPWL